MTVIGHQWWWEFRYPDLGVVTANELHVPVSSAGDRRPTYLRLESVDVVHSFWIPQLNGKTDVIPNRVNRMWIEPMQPGLYLGPVRRVLRHAARAHAAARDRRSRRRSSTPGWRRSARRRRSTRRSRPGATLFQSVACINCHRVGGTVADGVFGPDLTHLMSRDTIGAGAAPNTPHDAARLGDRSRPAQARRADAGDEAERAARSTRSSRI